MAEQNEQIERYRLVQNGDDLKQLLSEIPHKVDKVLGMGLSHNDFTDDEKYKLQQALTQHQPISHLLPRTEANTLFQPRGNYQPAGDYQPRGNYQPAGNYQPRGDYPTKEEIAAAYQVILRSGINIKTINGHSILGSGNIVLVGEGAEEANYLSTDGGKMKGLLETEQIKPKNDSGAVVGSSKAHYSLGYFDAIVHGMKVDGDYPATPQEAMLASYDSVGKVWKLGSNIVLGSKTLLSWIQSIESKTAGDAAALGVDHIIDPTNPSSRRVPTTQAIVDYLEKKEAEGDSSYDFLDSVGIAIMTTDSKFYASVLAWLTAGSPEVNGIAISDGVHRRVIALDGVIGQYLRDTTYWTQATTNTDSREVALADFDGFANTEAIIRQAGGDKYSQYYSDLTEKCNAYTFPNGAKAYMPSVGEMQMVMDNMTAINEMLSALNGTAVGAGVTHVSTTSTKDSRGYYYFWGYNIGSSVLEFNYYIGSNWQNDSNGHARPMTAL